MAIDHPARPDISSAAEAALELVRSAATLIGQRLGRDFLFFLFFGGIAAAVNLAVGGLLYDIPALAARCPYWLAVAIGATSGLFVNFLLNYEYNFRFRGRSALAQFRTFCVVAAIGIGLTALISSALLAFLHALGGAGPGLHAKLLVSPDFAAHFCAVGLVTFYSYLAHKSLTFNRGIRHRLRGLVPTLHG
jgi:putative flippase GtrA